MNSKSVTFGIGIALVILAAFAVPAMAGPNTMYFTNYSGDTSPSGTSYVELWLNLTDPIGDVDPNYGYKTADINITIDKDICNIIAVSAMSGAPWDGLWDYNLGLHDGAWIMVRHNVQSPPPFGLDPGVYPVANITLEGNNSGITGLDFSHEYPRKCEMADAGGNLYPNQTWEDGQFSCMGLPEYFEKELCPGWNLISLPLTPVNNSTSAVLGNDTIEYDVVYRYDATAKQFECPSTMDPGIGYFVNVTTAGTWNYTGTAYTSMNIDLKQGLNCIGWVNTSANLPDAMSSISGNYRYVAGWDASNSKYEVYDANAPAGVPEFIDFTTMERGNGYWIAAEEDCTLNV